MSMPSSSHSTANSLARRFSNDDIAPIKLGVSTKTASPGSSSTLAMKSSPCWEPLASRVSAGVDSMPLSERSRSQTALISCALPRVTEYWKTWPRSRSTRSWRIWRNFSCGKVCALGEPAANEITCGWLTKPVSWRISDERITRASRDSISSGFMLAA